jgi:predicted nucleic acid-binding protein
MRWFVLDTNVLIGYLAGDDAAVAFVDAAREHQDSLSVSVITEIELLASPALELGDEVLIDRLLASLEIIALYSPQTRRAAALRREHRIALGDAIIAAAAQSRSATLVTRDQSFAKRATRAGIIVEVV